MSSKPLEIKNYLSEKLELLSELLNKGEDTLLVSPTDSGKTRAIISYAKQNPQRRIAVLCPTQALVDNLKQDCDMPAGYGKKWAQNTQFFNLLVTTYDSIQFFEENRFDAIFIDEAHYLAQAGIYRVKALEYMMGLECQKILVTATPNVIERLEGFTRVEFVKETKPKVSLSLKLFSELTIQEKDTGKQLAKLMFRTSKIWKTDTKAFTKIKGNYLNLHLLSILRVVFLVTSPVVT